MKLPKYSLLLAVCLILPISAQTVRKANPKQAPAAEKPAAPKKAEAAHESATKDKLNKTKQKAAQDALKHADKAKKDAVAAKKKLKP